MKDVDIKRTQKMFCYPLDAMCIAMIIIWIAQLSVKADEGAEF